MTLKKVIHHPKGMGVGDGNSRFCYGSIPKMWLVEALAGAGLASSIIGGINASKAAKKAARRQRELEAQERAWYNRRYNEDYIDTAAGQNLVRRAKDINRENWRKAAGAQAVAGGTDASVAMAKEQGNKMVGNTIADIAANDQARKSHVDDLHRQATDRFAQMDMQREMQRDASITQAASGASNALMGLAGALAQGGSGKTNLQGGSNNSTEGSTPHVDSPSSSFIEDDIIGYDGMNNPIYRTSRSL